MKKGLISLVFVLAFTTWSCSKLDKCNGIDCFTPPSPFEFELVDKSTGENLFTSGALNPDDITLVNLDDQSSVDFQFIDENDYNVIVINSIGWQSETVNYSLEISSESLFTLFVDCERLVGDCCSYTRYNEIAIEGLEYEQQEQDGIYKMMVE